MRIPRLFGRAGIVAILAIGALVSMPRIGLGAPTCETLPDFTWLGAPLARIAHHIANNKPVTIVAVGSSSTAGAGASTAAASYPSRLEAELTRRFPGHSIRVLNRGVNGEEAADMIARFENGVLSEHPDLVLWQVGTNAVLRDLSIDGEAPLIREGIRKLKSSGADVILLNPQFAPRVLDKFDVFGMVDLIGGVAKAEGAGLFQRFALMRHWYEAERIPFDDFLSPDGLHMNDWSYACVARVLADAISQAVASPRLVAGTGGARR